MSQKASYKRRVEHELIIQEYRKALKRQDWQMCLKLRTANPNLRVEFMCCLLGAGREA